jgi:transporter family protein
MPVNTGLFALWRFWALAFPDTLWSRYGASWVCYFRALKLGDAARVAPIDKLSVVLVAMFGELFLGERLTPLNWLGVAMIAGGTILVAWKI